MFLMFDVLIFFNKYFEMYSCHHHNKPAMLYISILDKFLSCGDALIFLFVMSKCPKLRNVNEKA